MWEMSCDTLCGGAVLASALQLQGCGGVAAGAVVTWQGQVCGDSVRWWRVVAVCVVMHGGMCGGGTA